LRRASLATPKGEVAYPAPAAIFDGKPRRLGAVPELGSHTQSVRGEAAEMPKMKLKSG
jgi:itaconate CoA-transferase